jgi:hypothetical protein
MLLSMGRTHDCRCATCIPTTKNFQLFYPLLWTLVLGRRPDPRTNRLDAHAKPHRRKLLRPGRVAQWESARFTRERSLVRNQPCPCPGSLHSGISLAAGDLAPAPGIPSVICTSASNRADMRRLAATRLDSRLSAQPLGASGARSPVRPLPRRSSIDRAPSAVQSTGVTSPSFQAGAVTGAGPAGTIDLVSGERRPAR